jgi:hypothetical protein
MSRARIQRRYHRAILTRHFLSLLLPPSDSK